MEGLLPDAGQPWMDWPCIWLVPLRLLLALGLSAREFFELLFVLAAGSGARAFGGGLLASRAFYFLSFQLIFNFGGICHVQPLSQQSLRSIPVRRVRITTMLTGIDALRKLRSTAPGQPHELKTIQLHRPQSRISPGKANRRSTDPPGEGVLFRGYGANRLVLNDRPSFRVAGFRKQSANLVHAIALGFLFRSGQNAAVSGTILEVPKRK